MHEPPQRPTLTHLLAEMGDLTTVFQPIADLATGRVVAFEALARFGSGTSPDIAFTRAHALGVGHDLEALALARALASPGRPSGTRLALNLSPSALTSAKPLSELPADLSEITIEITENELVVHDDAIIEQLRLLRARGALIAVDDAGAGYAGMRQVMHLQPDIIKLDRSLVTDVRADGAKRAMIHAFVEFARNTAATICAEGIEHLDDLRALSDLDVATGQGYLLAAPAAAWPAIDGRAAQACRAGLARALRGADARRGDEGEAVLERLGARLAACTAMHDVHEVLAELRLSLGVAGLSLSREVRPALTPAVLREDEHAAALVVPLVAFGEPVGVLEARSRSGAGWTRRQITLCRAVAHQLAPIVERLGPAASPVAAVAAVA